MPGGRQGSGAYRIFTGRQAFILTPDFCLLTPSGNIFKICNVQNTAGENHECGDLGDCRRLRL